ncbi:MAG TPA: hypothetical protein VN598_06705 [Usitatibacter sp.]|nr:hypothetical protein [Usitatibacter sp.]
MTSPGAAGVFAGILAFASLLSASLAAAAPIKVDEGFASRIVEDETKNPKPLDSVTSINAGQGVYYWIKWKGYPDKATVRCVITDSDGDVAFDDSYDDEDNNPVAQYTLCGGETDARDFPSSGRYTFVQYLDGDKVGEQSINIERAWRISRYKKMKWTFAAIIFAAMAALWVYRKMRGDHAGASDLFKTKSQRRADSLANDPVVIGARLNAGAGAVETAAAKVSNEDAALSDAQRKFQSAMALSDKSMGLEAGKRYVALLLKARRGPEALGVFKACLAADPNFRVAPEDVLPLAKAARGAGDSNAAVAAVRGFDKANPGHALLPEVYFMSAQIMAEDLKNTAMARKVLDHLVAKYPGHHLAAEARRYLLALPA